MSAYKFKQDWRRHLASGLTLEIYLKLFQEVFDQFALNYIYLPNYLQF